MEGQGSLEAPEIAVGICDDRVARVTTESCT